MDKINDKLKILICCHKKSELPPDPEGIFLPIHVGAALSQGGGGLSLQRDDQVNGEPCDNISAKNGSYCELTAMYWAWKNIKKLYPNLEYIGLNHYRRYFSFDERTLFSYETNKPMCEITKYKINIKKLCSLLKRGYSIVTKLAVFRYPLDVSFLNNALKCDFKILRRIVHNVSPEYDEIFYTALMRGNSFSFGNMAIMRWEDFVAYCSWLFEVLVEAEKFIDPSSYKGNQKRIFGYMAEYLFHIWFLKNRIKIKRINVNTYRDDFKNKKDNVIKRCVNLLICTISVRLLRPWHKHITDWAWLDKDD